MFDRIERHEHEGDRVTVNIKQQPNDAADAARLYGECEEKARKAIVGAEVDRLGANNELIVLRVGSEVNLGADTQRARIIFKLNGVLHDMDVPIDRVAMVERAYDVVGQKLFEAITKTLQQSHRLGR